MHVLTSFGLVYLMSIFGNWGINIILITTTVAFMWAIYYFDRAKQHNHLSGPESHYRKS